MLEVNLGEVVRRNRWRFLYVKEAMLWCDRVWHGEWPRPLRCWRGKSPREVRPLHQLLLYASTRAGPQPEAVEPATGHESTSSERSVAARGSRELKVTRGYNNRARGIYWLTHRDATLVRQWRHVPGTLRVVILRCTSALQRRPRPAAPRRRAWLANVKTSTATSVIHGRERRTRRPGLVLVTPSQSQAALDAARPPSILETRHVRRHKEH
jgi:hypothetical protein